MAHGDYTGNNKAALAARFRDQQQLAAQSTSLVTAVVAEGRKEVIDLYCEADHENLKRLIPSPDSSDEVIEVDNEDPDMQPVKFRASETLDDISVGKDRQFNLEAGQIYKAPRWVVRHLDEKNLVWH